MELVGILKGIKGPKGGQALLLIEGDGEDGYYVAVDEALVSNSKHSCQMLEDIHQILHKLHDEVHRTRQ